MSKSPLDVLYGAFTRAENRVGGGEGLVGIYGSMTQAGTCSIMAAMVEHADMGPNSTLVDIGSGLCRPLLHASLEHNVHRTFGVELDAVKCQKAVPFVQHTTTMLEAEGVQIPHTALPTIICADVEQLGSLEPATHAYAAWEGFPESAKRAIGKLFAATPCLQAITIVQRSLRNQDPAEVMKELGFGEVECKAAALPVFMAGSGRKLNAYLFTKAPASAGGSQRGKSAAAQGPSLLTSTPFDPAHVICELQVSRMNSCTAAAGSPSKLERGSSVSMGVHSSGHGLRSRKGSAAPAPSSNAMSISGVTTTSTAPSITTARAPLRVANGVFPPATPVHRRRKPAGGGGGGGEVENNTPQTRPPPAQKQSATQAGVAKPGRRGGTTKAVADVAAGVKETGALPAGGAVTAGARRSARVAQP